MIELKECRTKAELKKFSRFAIDLYEGNDCYVPQLIDSEVEMFDHAKNPSLDFCDAIAYLALKDGKPVGRIAGIINPNANEKTGQRRCRFSLCDFVDDPEVSRVLVEAVAQWGRSHGMDELVGPLGFTDMDMEGCLIEGFDQLSTSFGIYNYPYYRQHFESLGMEVDARWKVLRMVVPQGLPERYGQMAEILKKRYGLWISQPSSVKEVMGHWGKTFFALYNLCYASLYGASELTEKQIDYYLKYFIPQMRLDHLRLVFDKDGKPVALGVIMPSLSKALRNANGSLWPFAWIKLLKTLKLRGQTDVCELMLIGVHPQWRGKGVHVMLFIELLKEMKRYGYQWIDVTNELENNNKVLNLWTEFNPQCTARRCTFLKKI